MASAPGPPVAVQPVAGYPPTSAATSAPVAPAPGASAPGTSSSAEECRQLIARISSLEAAQVESKRAQAGYDTQQARAGLDAATRNLTASKQRVAAAEAELEKYANHWVPGKMLSGKAKQEQKKTEMKSAVDAARASAASAETEVRAATDRLQAAQAAESELASQVALLVSLRAQRQTQLDALFAASAATDAEMAGLSQAAGALRGEAAQNRGWAGQYAEAQAGLKHAAGELAAATGMLKKAQFVGRVEMVDDLAFRRAQRREGIPPGMGFRREGMMGEVMQMGQVRRANDMVAAAARDILAVHNRMPSLPYIEPALVKSCAGGIFLDVLMGNMLSEIVVQQKIKQSLASVERMTGECMQCVEWATQNAAAFQSRAADAERNAAAKEAELQSVRLRKLQTL